MDSLKTKGVDNIYILEEDDIKLIFALLSVVFITHAVFFMTVSYIVTGDPFLALKNFYLLRYNMGV
ncbi:MAG: hypothetical protein J6P09_09835 [Methanobrevibacter sp.]|uniref:hypothetical protein n=1 Tax=Methanobrevibacter sp. TaxID=66852 RepID=UPI001B1BC933|nr:hypothetical protein [Methanobrevibacter sp.]MBO6124125.1 hypothetical protein [Methanobrevibacter sp.]MBP3791367.1 hypothetical protein [Methanobrevibacter sp.]